MGEQVSIAAAITELLRDMPSLTASAGLRAAWFRRKAALFRRIAADPASLNAAEAAALAVEADRRADLIGGA
jgi:hypothetical protein